MSKSTFPSSLKNWMSGNMVRAFLQSDAAGAKSPPGAENTIVGEGSELFSQSSQCPDVPSLFRSSRPRHPWGVSLPDSFTPSSWHLEEIVSEFSD